ncbi:unnamed protein product [Prorocentrum cordatum]|uniref:Pre-mRNA-splicing factor SLU7 n=1 Tax=Prorocentrum cordatum TaxID=2364126 RepID=A0ABN9T135_9DINO|nr:unnamed protein product [Polarella glacialis]
MPADVPAVGSAGPGRASAPSVCAWAAEPLCTAQAVQACGAAESAKDAYARDKTRMKDYYRAWDSFDVDKMEEELDAEEREEAEARRVHFEGLKEEQDEANRGSAIRVDGLPDGVPEAHRKYLADCEKEKGNEAFYSKDRGHVI